MQLVIVLLRVLVIVPVSSKQFRVVLLLFWSVNAWKRRPLGYVFAALVIRVR